MFLTANEMTIMTVAELIAELQKFDPALPVECEDDGVMRLPEPWLYDGLPSGSASPIVHL